ncbi:hypothetical protein BDQ17DRAFT_1332928 [Cyathus striatus]|nr:hypothetical protein BDQ17DRAFT_1332928 [Cyathus striatus]
MTFISTPISPTSSLGLSKHADKALPEGPPFQEFYQPGQKPAISDYSQDAQPATQMVIDEYEVWICTIDVFPSEKASLGWMHNIWAQAMESQGENWVLMECIRHLIRSHGSHICGHLIKNVHLLIQLYYRFSGIANTSATIKNQGLCERLLLNSAFHYQNPQLLKGYCQNAIIGFHKQAPFTIKVAETKYNAHLKDLETWCRLNLVVTEKICNCSAGVDVDEQAAPQLVGDFLESTQMELEGRTGDSDLDDDVEPESKE